MKNSATRKLKQVPAGYLVIGADSHKKRHAAVTIAQNFTTRSKSKLNNSREDFREMLEWAKAEMEKAGCRGVIFAIETGGQYWRNLAYFYIPVAGLVARIAQIGTDLARKVATPDEARDLLGIPKLRK